MLEVILTREVETLGDRGDIVRVAPGYARNYLYPKQMALPATAANKKQIEEMRAAAAKRATKLIANAEEQAEKMKGLTLRVVRRAGETNVLFGSVTARDIAAKLAEAGFEVERQRIILEKPIKEVNDYDVRVHLYRDVNVEIKIEVRAEGREDEPLVTPEERAAAIAAEADAFAAAQQAAEERARKVEAGEMTPEEARAEAAAARAEAAAARGEVVEGEVAEGEEIEGDEAVAEASAAPAEDEASAEDVQDDADAFAAEEAEAEKADA